MHSRQACMGLELNAARVAVDSAHEEQASHQGMQANRCAWAWELSATFSRAGHSGSAHKGAHDQAGQLPEPAGQCAPHGLRRALERAGGGCAGVHLPTGWCALLPCLAVDASLTALACWLVRSSSVLGTARVLVHAAVMMGLLPQGADAW